MNINTSNSNRPGNPALVPLGIAMDYQVNWNVRRVIRDFVQNFYDSIGYERFAEEFQYEWEMADPASVPFHCKRKGDSLHVRMRTLGHAFSYEWLSHIGGSTKTGRKGYAGEYGEGFKIAMLCLVKLGGSAVMSSENWLLYPCEYMEEIDGQKIKMFGYYVEERVDDGFTTLDLYGVPVSEKNIRYVEEALEEFFYPENVLIGEKVESTDGYALYGRTDIPVPCADPVEIQGVLYYKYAARGRLPFPAVIHLMDKRYEFESDRSRELFSEAGTIETVYKLAEKLSPKASLWLLSRMKKQWKEVPKFRKDDVGDLHTWYYVICQLVRNVSSDAETVKQFVYQYPLEDYAYIERTGSDRGKNRLLLEAENWFAEENTNGKQRRLVNPIFRLLGVPSVLTEYMKEKEIRYRKPDEEERKRLSLLKECAGAVLSCLLPVVELPEILIYTAPKAKRRNSTLYEDYGISPHVETRIEKVFSGKNKKYHIKYRVKAVVLEAEDFSYGTDLRKILLKYIDACIRMYGMESSARSNAVLTEMGAAFYQSRNLIGEYVDRWNMISTGK